MTASPRYEAPPGTVRQGLADINRGTRHWPIWWSLTLQQVRSAYRRTRLGPWWITAQMIVFVAGLSLLFGTLLHQELATFVPYVTAGFISFSWMTGMIQGGATCLIDNASAIRTVPGPMSNYALRNLAGNTIQFGHDAIVIIAVIVIFRVPLTWSVVFVPLAVLAICINGIAIGLWLGPVVARYRDVGQIVTSIVRVLFFFTPVFWVATDITHKQLTLLAGWNPLAYLLEFFRAPLLGQNPSQLAMTGVTVITIINILLGVLTFSRTRNRIAYWV